MELDIQQIFFEPEERWADPAIALLYGKLRPRRARLPTLNTIRRWERIDDAYWYVLANDRDLIALGGLDQETDVESSEVRLSALVVADAYEAQGYGRAMVEFLEEEARERLGALAMRVESSTAALHFYERMGYEPHPGSERELIKRF